MGVVLKPDPVRVALTKALKDDSELMELATAVFYEQIPSSAERPYVVVSKMSGVPLYALDGPSLDKDVWLVKGIGSAAQAETLSGRIKKILRGITLEIEGKVNQDLRKIADVDFGETEKGEDYRHSGAEYKLDSEEEE